MRKLTAIAIIVLIVTAACGGDSAYEDETTPAAAATTSPGSTPGTDYSEGQVTPTPTEFRVALINLMSPVSVDANNPIAGQTFDERIDAIIEELQELKPDLVGLTEATWTAAHGSAIDRIARGLKMEWQYVRSNPWFPGQTKEGSDQVSKQIGLDEGDCILSRYPILRSERKALNPRTSETEGRAALHVVLKAPAPLGELDVYITHLTGGGEKVRQAQATDLAAFVKSTRNEGPVLVLADLSDPPGSPAVAALKTAGWGDLAEGAATPTCCREAIVGEQPALVARTDYLFSDALIPSSVALFGDTPRKRPDGTLLYGSDHNGLFAVFPLHRRQAETN